MKVYVLMACSGRYDDYSEKVVGISRNKAKIEKLMDDKCFPEQYKKWQIQIYEEMYDRYHQSEFYKQFREMNILPAENESEDDFNARKDKWFSDMFNQEEQVMEQIGNEVLKDWGLNRNFMPEYWMPEDPITYRIDEHEEL